MFQDNTIYQESANNEQSEGISELSPTFFINLHQLEMKFMRLRYKQHPKYIEEQLIITMQKLLAQYTDCIDYFSSLSEHVQVYYQAKLKEMSKYYELVKKAYAKQIQSMTFINQHNTDKDQLLTIQDLGSITSQTRSRVQMLIDQNDQSLDSKDVFNQSVMLCLQNQNVKIHLQENMKKREKVKTKIVESLQNQVQEIEQRISNRKIKIHKKQISKSFSDNTTFQADLRRKSKPFEIQIEQIEQLSNFDMDALEADSPQKLKQLMESKTDK